MKNKRKFYFGALIVLIGVSVLLYASSQRRKAFDEFEVAGPTFRIRVSAYHDSAPLSLPGALYVFRSAPLNSESWHEILTYKADEPVSITDDRIRFVHNHIAYAYLGNYYMVTTDSGSKWFVWDANKQLPVQEIMQQRNLWPAIKAIEMQPDGRGTMTLFPYLNKGEKGPSLKTSDYGYHWSIDP
jgi:hypothetical protein